MLLQMALFHFFFFFIWLISGLWMYSGSKFQIFYMVVILYPLDPAFPLVLSDAALPVTCMHSSFTDFLGVGGGGVSPVSGPLHMLRFFSLPVSFFHLDNTNSTFRYNCKCQLLRLDPATKLELPVYRPMYFLLSVFPLWHNCKRCWFVCLVV